MTESNVEKTLWLISSFLGLLFFEKLFLHQVGTLKYCMRSAQDNQMLAIKFHKKAFKERMDDNIFAFEGVKEFFDTHKSLTNNVKFSTSWSETSRGRW
jgi:hypothetical protein